MADVWVSVILPTWNGAAYLEAALESLCRQEEPSLEVIAVDDGSTDGTLAILQSFAGRMALRIVARPHRGNWVANTNYGMGLARGRYLAWLHQDDVWAANRLAVLRGLAERWPQAVLLFHPVWYIDASGRRVGRWCAPFAARTACLSSEAVVERLLVHNFVAASAAVFPAAVWREVGALDERLWYLADWDFWLRLARRGPVVYHPVPLGSFRLHAESQTRVRFAESEDLAQQYRIVLARHLDGPEPAWRNGTPAVGAARFSAELTLAMSEWMAGRRVAWGRLARGFWGLGPAGWFRFVHHSRIVARCAARLRAGVLGRGPAKTSSGLRGDGSDGSTVVL